MTIGGAIILVLLPLSLSSVRVNGRSFQGPLWSNHLVFLAWAYGMLHDSMAKEVRIRAFLNTKTSEGWKTGVSRTKTGIRLCEAEQLDKVFYFRKKAVRFGKYLCGQYWNRQYTIQS